MTETTYYTLLAVTTPRHGYAIMQFVGRLTRERLLLGTGTLYTMVGRLAADGIIQVLQEDGKKSYLLTQTGMDLLGEETKRLGQQLADGLKILSGGGMNGGLKRLLRRDSVRHESGECDVPVGGDNGPWGCNGPGGRKLPGRCAALKREGWIKKRIRPVEKERAPQRADWHHDEIRSKRHPQKLWGQGSAPWHRLSCGER